MRVLDVQFQKSWCVAGAGEGLESLRRSSRRPVTDTRMSRHHQLHRRHRSRSSPVRAQARGGRSPRGHARSPSASPPRHPRPSHDLPLFVPDNSYIASNYGGAGTTAYYSPRPPVRPLHIVALPTKPIPVAVPAPNPLTSRFLLQPDIVKAKKKEARQVVRRLLRSFLRDIPLTNLALHVEAVPTLQIRSIAVDRRDIAVQAQSLDCIAVKESGPQNDENTDWNDEEEEESEAMCEWAGGVRALRDSHVRLLLRQLRQLRHIERLNRALRRVHTVQTAAQPSLS